MKKSKGNGKEIIVMEVKGKEYKQIEDGTDSK